MVSPVLIIAKSTLSAATSGRFGSLACTLVVNVTLGCTSWHAPNTSDRPNELMLSRSTDRVMELKNASVGADGWEEAEETGGEQEAEGRGDNGGRGCDSERLSCC